MQPITIPTNLIPKNYSIVIINPRNIKAPSINIIGIKNSNPHLVVTVEGVGPFGRPFNGEDMEMENIEKTPKKVIIKRKMTKCSTLLNLWFFLKRKMRWILINTLMILMCKGFIFILYYIYYV